MAITFNHNDQVYVKDGNLGVGTNSPEARVHIKITDSGATPISQQHLILEHNSATGLGILTTSATSGYIFFGDESDAQRGYISYNHPTDDMSFKVAGSERMRIDSSGNVGIGTTSPADKLHVYGGRIRVSNVNGLYIDSSATYGGNAGATFSIVNDSNSNPVLRILNANASSWANTSINPYGSNVGIGTLNPGSTLDVAASVPVIRLTDTRNLNVGDWDDVSLGKIEFYTSDTTSPGARALAEIEAYSGPGAASGPEAELRFKTSTINDSSPVQRMVIDAEGRLGLGTTNPGDTFQIHDSTTTSNPKIKIYGYDTATTSAKYGSLHIGTDGSFIIGAQDTYLQFSAANYIQSNSVHFFTQGILQSNNKGFSVQESGGSFKSIMNVTTGNLVTLGGVGSGWSTGGDVALFTAGSEKVRIDTSGNVGIGTTSPQAGKRLDVRSDASIAGSNAIAGYGYNDSGIAILANGYATSGTGRNYGLYGISTGTRTGGTNVGGHFSASGAGTNYALTTGSGNVGIGTSDPSYKLDVSGEVRADAYRIDLSATTQRALSSTGTDSLQIGDAGVNDIKFKNAAGNSFIINSSGNVGIGDTAPTSKLSVLFNSNSYAAGYFRNSGTAPSLQVNQQGTGAIFEALDNSSSVFIIKDGGNVGIGTTSPAEDLHIGNNNPVIQIGTINSTTGNSKIQFYSGSNGTFNGYAIQYTKDTGVDRLDFIDGGGTAKISFQNGGNVGIGTTSPDYKLHIVNSQASHLIGMFIANSRAYGVGQGAYGAGIWLGKEENGGNQPMGAIIGSPTAETNSTEGQLIFQTRSSSSLSDRMVIRNNGNVGIGTTSPSVKLEVSGDLKVSDTIQLGQQLNIPSAGLSHHTNGYLYIKGGTAGLSLINDSASSGVYVVDNGTLEFYAGSSNKMHITSAGNVGIGTTSPTQKLDVVGNAQVQGVLYVTKSGENSRFNSADANGPYISFRNNGTAKGYVGSGFHLWTSPNNLADNFGIRAENQLDFGIGASVKMTLNSSGNVGIGTTSPSQKLHVTGNIKATGWIGRDSNNYITFDETNNHIDFYAGGNWVARMESDGDLHVKGDVIAFSDIFNP